MHVFALEQFHDAVKVIARDIGFVVHDARKLTGHGTDAVALLDHGLFADTPLHDLAAMKRAGSLPRHAQLYDSALAGGVSGLYKDDIAI